MFQVIVFFFFTTGWNNHWDEDEPSGHTQHCECSHYFCVCQWLSEVECHNGIIEMGIEWWDRASSLESDVLPDLNPELPCDNRKSMWSSTLTHSHYHNEGIIIEKRYYWYRNCLLLCKNIDLHINNFYSSSHILDFYICIRIWIFSVKWNTFTFMLVRKLWRWL